MECPDCKAQISNDSHFCRHCGSRIVIQGVDPDTSTRRFRYYQKLLPGSTFLGRYNIVEELGRGGMGVVYKAEDTKLRRNVALKFLPGELTRHPEAKERFIHEAQAASALDHPNICTVYEIEETDDGQIFISMGCYEGETLQEKIRKAPVPADEASDIAIQVARGLEEAHEKGIVHRDIKPSNVIVTTRGQAKVMDFGLAKLAGQTRLTKAGTTMGTVAYMSPEQARGEDVDHRTDVWSLGVVLYEMATGELPFKGEYDQAVIYSILNEDPKPVREVKPGLSAEFEAVVARCLSKSPDDRYSSSSELAAALMPLAGDAATRWSGARTGIGRAPGTLARGSLLRVGIPAAVVILAVLLLTVVPTTRDAFMDLVGTGGRAGEMRVAILPCTLEGKDVGQRAFCDGMTLVLTGRLRDAEGLPPGFSVISAGDTRLLRSMSPTQARVQLGASTVVTGSIKWAGDRIELTLVRSDIGLETEGGIESEVVIKRGSTTISDPLANLATWQDTVFTRLLGLLDLPVTRIRSSGREGRQTGVPGAYALYLEGLGHLFPYGSDQEIDEAIESLSAAVDEDPSYCIGYVELGKAYSWKYWYTKERQWADLALEASGRAVEIDDGLVPAYLLMGRVYLNAGEYENAVASLLRAIELDSLEAGAYDDLGAAYREMRDFDAAEAALLRAIELDPLNDEPYSNLGWLYYMQGKYEAAIEPFRKVTQLLPYDISAFNYLGSMYFMLEKWPEAAEMFERCLAIDSTSRVCSNLGTVYFYQTRYADAARMYKRALGVSDTDYKIWGHLAESEYWTPGDREASFRNFRKAISLAEADLEKDESNAVTLSDLAGYYGSLGDEARARALLQQVIDLDPSDHDVIIRIAETYEKLGEREIALEWIAKAIEGGVPSTRVQRYPGLGELRADPRFRAMIEEQRRPS